MDARRTGPLFLILIGAILVVASFFDRTGASNLSVGTAPTTTACTLVIGVAQCPTTTLAPTTTVKATTTTTSAPTTSTTVAVTATTSIAVETTVAKSGAGTGATTLPVTGSPSPLLLALGLTLILFGGLLLAASRRHGYRAVHRS